MSEMGPGIQVPFWYESGEFDVPGLGDRDCRSAVLFDGKLHVLGFGPDVLDTVFDLDQLRAADGSGDSVAAGPGFSASDVRINTAALKDPTHWTNTTVPMVALQSGRSWGGATTTPESIVAVTWTSGYAFVIPMPETEVTPLCAHLFSMNASTQTQEWSQPAVLRGTDGNPLPGWSQWYGQDWAHRSLNVGVTAFGSSQIIVCAPSPAGPEGRYSSALRVAIFDTARIDHDKAVWPAASVVDLQLADMRIRSCDAAPQPGDAVTFAGVGTEIDIEWFSTVGDDQQLVHYLAIRFAPVDPSDPHYAGAAAMAYLPLRVSSPDAPTATVTLEVPTTITCDLLSTAIVSGTSQLSGLSRDPAGRLRGFLYDAQPSVRQPSLYSTTGT
jgi:hypothetical protein